MLQDAPAGSEVRSFQIGPISEEQYLRLSPEAKNAIQRTIVGDDSENAHSESDFIPAEVSIQMRAVADEIVFALVPRILRSADLGALLHDVYATHISQNALSNRTCAEWQSYVLQSIVLGLRTALHEVLFNHAVHGNKDPRLPTHGKYSVDDSCKITVETWDQGNGFDPLKIPDPTDLENLDRPHGRGLLLMRTYMDNVRHTGGQSGKMGSGTIISSDLGIQSLRKKLPLFSETRFASRFDQLAVEAYNTMLVEAAERRKIADLVNASENKG